jgi:hypothetical protein
MMRRLILVTDCFLLLCATGCYPQHTIYIGPASSSLPATIEGYAKKGSTVEWAVSSSGESYTINFLYSTAPCEDATHLTATFEKPATCKIVLPRGYPKKQDPLRYEYTIQNNNSKKDAAPPPQQYYQRVGSCDTCATSQKGGLAAAASTPPPPPGVTHSLIISCTPPPPSITPDPTTPVSVGDVIYWNNPNGKSKPSFTVAFTSGAPCTIASSSGSASCSITTLTNSPYAYSVTVGDGHSNGGCTVTGTISAAATHQ